MLKHKLHNTPLAKPRPESTRSFVAVLGHPLHPMLVAFPIAYVVGSLASDLAYWWSADPFWARVSLWIIGAGLAMGLIAAIAGTMDFMIVKEIRRLETSWSHFLAAVMLLALTAANWWLRVPDAEEAILPWGLFLSAISLVALTTAGWLGGKLVFEHQVGIDNEDEPIR